jgi:hypothetical protein
LAPQDKIGKERAEKYRKEAETRLMNLKATLEKSWEFNVEIRRWANSTLPPQFAENEQLMQKQ